MPRFGPAYVPPPTPEPAGGRGIIVAVILLDVVLLTFAAVITFGPWISRPLSLYLAGVAILIGGLIACAPFLGRTHARRPPRGAPKPSNVRVRLTRL